jgi:hypothetical protein
MGPVALSITSVVLIGLMAVLYLTQLGQAEEFDQQLQQFNAQQSQLQRQNQDLLETVAHEQSPSFIISHAQQQGLVPADPQKSWIIKVSGLQATATPIAQQPSQP